MRQVADQKGGSAARENPGISWATAVRNHLIMTMTKIPRHSLGRFSLATEAFAHKNSAIVCCLLSTVAAYFTFLFFFNATLFYNPIGWLDPYVYVGYGLYYSYPDFMDGYYKVSRLPWNLLEFLARHVFHPSVAAPMLQFFSFSLMSMCAFFYFRLLINRSSALFIAILCIFLPILYVNGGADYHNTITGPLYFLALALLVESIVNQSRARLLAGYAGAAVGAAIHTDPLLILLAPAVTLQCLSLWRTYKRNVAFVLTSIVILIIGFACTTIGLGLISAAFGRSFLFFKPQIDYIFWIQQEHHNIWWSNFSWEWLRNNKINAYLISIFVICIFELLWFAVRRQANNAWPAICAYAGYGLSYLVALAWQLKGQTTLYPDYLSYMLVVATFTPLGFLLDRYLPPVSRGTLLAVAVLFPLACAIALLRSSWIYETFHLLAVSAFSVVVVTVIGTYFILIAFKRTRLNVGIVILPLLCVALVGNPKAYVYDSCNTVAHLNVFMNAASLLATRIAGHPKQVYVFADPIDRITRPCFKGIAVADVANSFAELGHNFLGEPFGQQQLDLLSRADFESIKSNGIIALFVVDTADRFLRTAAGLGISLQIVGILPDRPSGLELYFLKLGDL